METEKISSCVICLEPISEDSGVTDCGHTFCAKCIKHWCEQCSACPLCRKEISEIKLFYRSFYLGQNIIVNHKKQKVSNNDDSVYESDFVVSDSEDILISNQNIENNYDQNEGTAWIDGSRHSLREQHRSNKQVEQRLMKIQIKNDK